MIGAIDVDVRHASLHAHRLQVAAQIERVRIDGRALSLGRREKTLVGGERERKNAFIVSGDGGPQLSTVRTSILGMSPFSAALRSSLSLPIMRISRETSKGEFDELI